MNVFKSRIFPLTSIHGKGITILTKGVCCKLPDWEIGSKAPKDFCKNATPNPKTLCTF